MALPSSSAIPTAVPALISMATTALPSDAMVYFGKALPVYTAPITLQVIKVVGNQDWIVLGPNYRREETFSIECQLTSFAGDNDHPARMSEVFTQFHALTMAVGNDPTLQGTVRLAEVGDFDYEPDENGNGMTLGCLTFNVRCSQRVASQS